MNSVILQSAESNNNFHKVQLVHC